MKETVVQVLTAFVVLLCIFISSCMLDGGFYEYYDDESPATPVINEEPDTFDQKPAFEVHFIDVGQADAALVICDEKAMLIDGGNKADSQRMYTYLEKNNIDYLDYVVATHVHEDHIGGIAGALSYADFGTVYCNTANNDSDLFYDLKKQVEKAGKSILVPNAGDTFDLGSAHVFIVSRMESDNENNSSIVLKVVYGDTSFLFTGDIEKEAEDSIVRSKTDIKTTVLKVAHHGSENSTLYPFLVAASPKFAIISTGENEYGHPSEDTLERLRIVEAECYRTDICGDIVCVSDGKSVKFSFANKT